jgi:adenosylcobyric acid synthase
MAAKTLMIQGTGSGVGKSVIVAALCRRFFKDGLRVAPFKAQNMSLNSFVTEDGGEMGRAQVFQAEACGLKPSVAMNPILLKPSSDNHSQIIVMGRPVANADAKNYYRNKETYFKEAISAFESLRQSFDLIVLEGAGSPAEINLKQHDIVNMRMAKLANAPVLIVGDIDRGGVFAWMKGTYDLLDTEEKNIVKGFLINKFRGDLDLLKPGLTQFEDLVHKPVLGVIPFDRELYVDEEDSVPLPNTPEEMSGIQDKIKIDVIRLPRISNFTDVSPLMHNPGILLRYVWRPDQIENPDLILIPGSKNVLEDMEFLRSQGLDKKIHLCHKNGTLILGICAGFQMLGDLLEDLNGIESSSNRVRGLGLFKMKTEIQPEKITRQTNPSTCESPVFKSGLNASGYEIHMGISQIQGDYPALFVGSRGDNKPELGISNSDGTVVGSYIHGFLDSNAIREAFLNHICQKRNLPKNCASFDYKKFRDDQMDRLCDLFSSNVDMEKIYEIVRC